jgi:hypothetical protein
MWFTTTSAVLCLFSFSAIAAANPSKPLHVLVNELKVSGPCAGTAQKCLTQCPSNTRDLTVEIQCKSGCETARAQCALDAANRQLGVITNDYVCLSPRSKTWEVVNAATIAEAQKAAGGDYRVNCRSMSPNQKPAAEAELANKDLQRLKH